MSQYKEYIQPIGECGIAFTAGGQLYTAGHVISEMDFPRFRYGSILYEVSSHVFHTYDTQQNVSNISLPDMSIKPYLS